VVVKKAAAANATIDVDRNERLIIFMSFPPLERTADSA
jgi:hypothetical protein